MRIFQGLDCRVALALALLFGVSSSASCAEGDLARTLIPQPKHCEALSGLLPMAVDGKPNVVIEASGDADPKETMAAKWIAREIESRMGQKAEIARHPSGAAKVKIVLSTFDRAQDHPSLKLLDAADRRLLADPKRAEQGYVIRTSENAVVVVGGSAQGTLYGAMTLLQLFQGGGAELSAPKVHVRDWPDFQYRMAENWEDTEGRMHWGRGWCYDWGDGPENYKRRVTELFDRCLRYKINAICFSSGFGEPFTQMWDGDAFPMQKELNQLADRRGIKLMIGGYGNGAGDKKKLNRESYPDGKEYFCLTTNNFGNCRSNEGLNEKIQSHIREYVRKTEPRALYIHHEDSDTYASAEWLWRRRCPKCKARWPNDAMAAADGAAGAFAHGYNLLCDAVFSVKNAESGYDAARDCLLIPISPTYSNATESDAEWDKQLAYWQVVAKLLKHRKNVYLGFREQFLRADNNKRRILEMSEALAKDDGPGMFLFFVGPASFYEKGPIFSPLPAVMNKLNEGADVIYYMCGNIFQEPLILLNAAHMWNTDSLGAVSVDMPAKKCRDLYNSYAKRQANPPGVFGKGGFMELACRTLYGEKAGRHMEKLYAMKRYPVCLAKSLFIWNIRSGQYYDWAPDLKSTQEAIACVEAALDEPDCKPEIRPILDRFHKSLKAGEHFVQVRLAYQKLTPKASRGTIGVQQLQRSAAEIEEQMQSMERYLNDNFTFDWSTPRGGDAGIWKTHLAATRRELAHCVKLWSEAMLAREAAKKAQAAGAKSLAVNGNMEGSGGWQFVCVTGEEDEGYADGGYATDKFADGRRSYRIIKKPVHKMSHKWPMPQRASWGEIQQEIDVEPGRKYAVTFSLFNNNGPSYPPGRLQHEVLVDGREMWSLDSSAAKGWTSSGFFVVPKTSKMTLTLRTTDLNPCGGWRQQEGDSWWDGVAVVPVEINDP